MDNRELTRLLFIRKELDGPVINKDGTARKSSSKAAAKPAYSRPIQSSPLYGYARARIYAATEAPIASTSTVRQAAVDHRPAILASVSPSPPLLNTPIQSRHGSEAYARSVIEISDSEVEIESAETGRPVIVVAWTKVRNTSWYAQTTSHAFSLQLSGSFPLC